MKPADMTEVAPGIIKSPMAELSDDERGLVGAIHALTEQHGWRCSVKMAYEAGVILTSKGKRPEATKEG